MEFSSIQTDVWVPPWFPRVTFVTMHLSTNAREIKNQLTSLAAGPAASHKPACGRSPLYIMSILASEVATVETAQDAANVGNFPISASPV